MLRSTILAAASQVKKDAVGPGFIGEVPFDSLITQNDLESLTGFTAVGAGTSQVNAGSNAWLEFITADGKRLYVAKKPIRSFVRFSQLNFIKVIAGEKHITVDGKQYKVRLLTGADIIDAPTTIPGGEWDSLLVRVHESHADGWADYTSADLGMTAAGGTGGVCLCQGQYTNVPGGARMGIICRGYPDPVRGMWYLPDNDPSNANYGWRPVLELI